MSSAWPAPEVLVLTSTLAFPLGSFSDPASGRQIALLCAPVMPTTSDHRSLLLYCNRLLVCLPSSWFGNFMRAENPGFFPVQSPNPSQCLTHVRYAISICGMKE